MPRGKKMGAKEKRAYLVGKEAGKKEQKRTSSQKKKKK
jgi:hypothetical protein